MKKSKEGASSWTSNVDEDLVRSFCLFSVMAPIFTFSRIRGKLIWFLVQHNLTSSDFLEWKKRLIHEEANIFIILLSWSSLKREHVLFSMIEGKLPRHMTWSALASNLSISGVYFGVRTCELFLCFAPFVFLRSIVLTSLFPLFYVTCEFNGSYTEDEPISVYGNQKATQLAESLRSVLDESTYLGRSKETLFAGYQKATFNCRP